MSNTPNTAREISNARLAYLRSRGENVRNTAAWRDAKYEALQLSVHENNATVSDVLACLANYNRPR